MRRLLAVAALVLAGGLFASPTSAVGPCENPGDIPILVDYGSLDTPSVTACAQDGAQMSAVAAITGAGVELEGDVDESTVCRVNGLPDEKSCDSWSLFIGRDGAWTPAQNAVDRQILAEGDFVALAFGDGSSPRLAPDDQLRSDAQLAPTDVSPADDPDARQAAEDDGPDMPLLIGAAVVVAVVALLTVVLLRRRR